MFVWSYCELHIILEIYFEYTFYVRLTTIHRCTSIIYHMNFNVRVRISHVSGMFFKTVHFLSILCNFLDMEMRR